MRSEADYGHSIGAAGAGKGQSVYSPAFKESCRRVLASGLYHFGILRMMRRLERSHEFSPSTSMNRFFSVRRSSGSKFGILCYHRVGTTGVPFHSRLKPERFEAQIRYLKKRYRIVPLGQLCCELLASDCVPPTLAITFDDGYRDLYNYALPVLQTYEIPATIYLIGRCMETGETPWYDRIFASLALQSSTFLEVETNRIRRFSLSTPQMRAAAAWEIVCYLRSIPDIARQQWCSEFDRKMRLPIDLLNGQMLDWEQVRTMKRAGISFGAHTMNHPAVSRLESAAYDNEFTNCKKLLENGLDASVEHFAYPFGKLADSNRAAEEFLARAGYLSAVTTVEGFNSFGDNIYTLRRLQIGNDCSLPLFAFNLARMFVEAVPEHAAAREF
jgi:peptidoglycan/xylan/chitin deacetylase (PgdA/CDA1 family)